ncbi:putative transporter YfdV [Legionella busanensis]|uniref:Putative transporter YfdV n=1 Tax=Legionella busanensis TaxID=190655 RepID=A0A378JLK8_9GAMM|nr:AEC family transporter [Legionella busanensis]STX51578.1 putative transporter YfdV [Legionella busanensis]
MYSVILELLPFILIILSGVIIEKSQILGTEGYKVLNKFAYYLGVPALLFSSFATASITFSSYENYSIAFILSMLGLYIPIFSYVFYKTKNINLATLASLGSVFPNSGFIGIPILFILFRQEGVITAALSTLLTLIPFSLAIIILERNKYGMQKAFLQTLLRIVRNPLLYGAAAGILISYANLHLPHFILKTTHLLGEAGVPCALLGIGQMLVIFRVRNLSALIVPVVIKLILHPLIAFYLFYLFNIEPNLLTMGVVLASLPTAVMQSILAFEFETYQAESSGLVMLSTVCSFISLPIILYFMQDIATSF